LGGRGWFKVQTCVGWLLKGRNRPQQLSKWFLEFITRALQNSKTQKAQVSKKIGKKTAHKNHGFFHENCWFLKVFEITGTGSY
jgi:hypothetical protein